MDQLSVDMSSSIVGMMSTKPNTTKMKAEDMPGRGCWKANFGCLTSALVIDFSDDIYVRVADTAVQPQL